MRFGAMFAPDPHVARLAVRGSGAFFVHFPPNRKRSVTAIGTGNNTLSASNQDRLLRFGSELVFSLCEHFGTEVIIVHASEDASFVEELVQDVLEIITAFSARLYGSRRHKNKQVLDGAVKAGIAATHICGKLFQRFEKEKRHYGFWILRRYGRIGMVLRGEAPEPPHPTAEHPKVKPISTSVAERKEVVRFLR